MNNEGAPDNESNPSEDDNQVEVYPPLDRTAEADPAEEAERLEHTRANMARHARPARNARAVGENDAEPASGSAPAQSHESSHGHGGGLKEAWGWTVGIFGVFFSAVLDGIKSLSWKDMFKGKKSGGVAGHAPAKKAGGDHGGGHH